MATFNEIKTLRLDISDPANYIDLLEVATPAALPAAPGAQTAYKVTSTGKYMATDTEIGAVTADYEAVELQLSDDRISFWLGAYTYDRAVVLALKAIIKRLGGQIPLVKNNTGNETAEYTHILDLYTYYRGLLAKAQEDVEKEDLNNTGKWSGSVNPEIGGGNL